MKLSSISWLLLIALAAGCSKGTPDKTTGDGQAFGGKTTTGSGHTENAAGISYSVPDGWKSSTPSSGMRAAQYTIPGGGVGEDGELVLYFFGAGQGGAVDANIDRWIGQVQQPDGKSSLDLAKKETRTVGPYKITTVAVNGTYSSGMMGGMGDSTTKDQARLWGAVIEGEGGPWFFKAVGPEKVIEKAAKDFDALLSSVKPSK